MLTKSMLVSKRLISSQSRAFSQHLKAFATIDPENLSAANKGMNLVKGEWVGTREYTDVIDPLTGKPLMKIPDTQMDEIEPFVSSLQETPRHGLHNPLKNKERYLMLGQVMRKMSEVLNDPDVFNFFCRLIQRSVPKSTQQCQGEMRVTRAFIENFAGDNVRFLAEGFKIPGDHLGQASTGYRWPFGPVGVITPFNFPLEIPVLQMSGALFMGNKPLVKPDQRASFPLEQWVRMMHYCGLPLEDLDLIYSNGPVMEKILKQGNA